MICYRFANCDANPDKLFPGQNLPSSHGSRPSGRTARSSQEGLHPLSLMKRGTISKVRKEERFIEFK